MQDIEHYVAGTVINKSGISESWMTSEKKPLLNESFVHVRFDYDDVMDNGDEYGDGDHDNMMS